MLAVTNWRPFAGAKQKNGDADAVLHSGSGGAEEEVGEEAMAVGAHRDEIASLVFDPLDDLVGGFAVGEFGVRGNIFRLQF